MRDQAPVVHPEEPEGGPQEETVQEFPEEEPGEELPECPDHRPSAFEQGKPRCIISMLYKIHLASFIFLCIKYRHGIGVTFAAFIPLDT